MIQYKTDCEIAKDEVVILNAELELTHKELVSVPWYKEDAAILLFILASFFIGAETN